MDNTMETSIRNIISEYLSQNGEPNMRVPINNRSNIQQVPQSTSAYCMDILRNNNRRMNEVMLDYQENIRDYQLNMNHFLYNIQSANTYLMNTHLINTHIQSARTTRTSSPTNGNPYVQSTNGNPYVQPTNGNHYVQPTNGNPYIQSSTPNLYTYVRSQPETATETAESETLPSMLLQTWITGLLRDVIIRPTEVQIDNATELIHYSNTIHSSNSCPISLDQFIEQEEVCVIKHCGHIFKKDSLYEWFRTSVNCPVCRYDIRTYVSAINNLDVDDATSSSSSSDNNVDDIR